MARIDWTDPDRLRAEIRKMRYKDELFRLLKEELSQLGHWKNRARGKPRDFRQPKVSNLQR